MIVGCHEIEVSKIGIIIMQGVSCSDLQRGMTPTDLMYAKKAYVSIENLKLSGHFTSSSPVFIWKENILPE